MTSYATFCTNLANLTITGVTRKYTYGETPPLALNDGELPASWVQQPHGDAHPFTFDGGSGWPTLQAELIVAVSAVGQSTMPDAFKDTVGMMDNVATALTNAVLAKTKTRWTISQEVVVVRSKPYWAVVAQVTANG